MLAYRLQHVTSILGRPQQRAFATSLFRPKTPRTDAVRPSELDPFVVRYLRETNFEHPSSISTSVFKTLKLPQGGKYVVVRYLPGRYAINSQDAYLLTNLAKARTVQRMAHYKVMKEQRPLWMNMHVRLASSVVVRSHVKRKFRSALRKAMADRGIHRYGWDLRAYAQFWKDHAKTPGVVGGLENVAKLLHGTMFVKITNPMQIADLPDDQTQLLADSVIHQALTTLADSAGQTSQISKRSRRTREQHGPAQRPEDRTSQSRTQHDKDKSIFFGEGPSQAATAPKNDAFASDAWRALMAEIDDGVRSGRGHNMLDDADGFGDSEGAVDDRKPKFKETTRQLEPRSSARGQAKNSRRNKAHPSHPDAGNGRW